MKTREEFVIYHLKSVKSFLEALKEKTINLEDHHFCIENAYQQICMATGVLEELIENLTSGLNVERQILDLLINSIKDEKKNEIDLDLLNKIKKEYDINSNLLNKMKIRRD